MELQGAHRNSDALLGLSFCFYVRQYRKIFAHEDVIVPYRLRKDGVYEARVRRKDLHIEVSARDFAALKEKFICALHKEEEPAPEAVKNPAAANFGEFTLQWLEVKQSLVKPSRFLAKYCFYDQSLI